MFIKVDDGWKHTGSGYKADPISGRAPVYILPRWNAFEHSRRHTHGTAADIYCYMQFIQALYLEDLSGDDIAIVMCNLYNTNPDDELTKLNAGISPEFANWSELYKLLQDHYHDQHRQQWVNSLLNCRR